MLMFKASYDIDHIFPIRAGTVSEENRHRVKIITDMLILCWFATPVVQGLGLLGSLSVPAQLHLLALLDAMSKLGTCHLMLNPRGQVALRKARETIASQGRFP